jgi:CBS domain-containing protein
MAHAYTVSQFIKPFEDRPVASPEKTIGQVLELTTSSHTPIYIFEDKKYRGVVSAYRSLFHNYHAPYTKKVVSELMHTPRLTNNSTLFDVLRAMMDTRLYELPIVNDDNEIIGVVETRDILKTILKDPILSAYVIDCIEVRNPVTHPLKGSVKDIYHTLRDQDVSRIMLTDENGKLAAIVTRSDIKTAFIRPGLRQRFRGKAEEQKQNIFDPKEEIYREDDPISRYAKTNVFSVRDEISKKDAINTLIKSTFNSLVLTNDLEKPTGILSLRDIVHCLGSFTPDIETAITFKKPSGAVPEEMIDKAQSSIERMVKKLSKIETIEKVDVAVQQQKFSNAKVAEYETRIGISMKGLNVESHARDKEYINSVQSAIAIAEKQFINRTKRSYHKATATI